MRKLRVGERYVQAIADRMFFKIRLSLLGADELRKLMIALRAHEHRQDVS
jgi:hypothetical protein